MRLKPHTYRRLAWVACWIVDPVENPFLRMGFDRPEEHELQCLNELLTLYKTVLERYPDVDFTVKTTEGLKCWKNLRKDEDESIRTLTILFPTQRSLAIFLKHFQNIFFISEIIKYCANGPLDSYKWHLHAAMFSCFGGPSRSFSENLSTNLFSYHSLFVNKNSASDQAIPVACDGVLIQEKNKKGNSVRRRALQYCELYRDLYSNDYPDSPKKSEIRRRKRISKTKQSRNRKSISLRKMHIKTILDRLESEKRTYSNLPVHERNKKEKPTRQRICKSYFERHTEELKKLQITSPRTLENLCSRKASGKHADEIRRQRNSIQACLPIDEPKLYSELNIRIQS